MFINHRDRRVSLRRPPGARARARDQERSEEIMAELAHTRRFLNRSTSIDVSSGGSVCVCVSLWARVYKEGKVLAMGVCVHTYIKMYY